MKWWDEMPWSQFSECWVLSWLFHSPLGALMPCKSQKKGLCFPDPRSPHPSPKDSVDEKPLDSLFTLAPPHHLFPSVKVFSFPCHGELEWTRFTMVVYVLISQSCQMVCDHGVCDPMGCSPPWNSPGKNTWVGSHFLLQGIFWTQESNLGLSHCRQILYHLSHLGSPQFSSVQSLSCVRLFATPWTAARQASLSITNCWSLLKLMPCRPQITILCWSWINPFFFPWRNIWQAICFWTTILFPSSLLLHDFLPLQCFCFTLLSVSLLSALWPVCRWPIKITPNYSFRH